MRDQQTQETNEAKRKMKATTSLANHSESNNKEAFAKADAKQDESAKQAQARHVEIQQKLAKQSNEIAELKSIVLDMLKSVKKIERALAEKDLNNGVHAW